MKIIKLLTLLFFITIMFFLSFCHNDREKNPLQGMNKDTIAIDKNGDNEELQDMSYQYLPKDSLEVEKWQERVEKEGDARCYNLLERYYDRHLDLLCERIKYTEYMIDWHGQESVYATQLFIYVINSNCPDKDILGERAILLLKKAMKDGNTRTRQLARSYLILAYRRGLYVDRDTIIARYLYNKGYNLDSIEKVGIFKK